MKTLYKLGIGLVLLLIVSVGLLSFWWEEQKQEMYRESYMSSYNYDVSITPDSNLNNVTLYLPIPVANNTSVIGLNIVEQHFNDDDLSWQYKLVKTEHGMMLSMTTEEVIPIFYSEPIEKEVPGDSEEIEMEITYITSNTYSKETPNPRPILDFSMRVKINETIDTLNPVGNAEVLIPKYDIRENEQDKRSSIEFQSFPDAKVYDYNSMIFAQYDASPDTDVNIYISMDGYNEWWIGGWRSNNFRESIITSLSGPQDGWVKVKGELVAGEGIYQEQ